VEVGAEGKCFKEDKILEGFKDFTFKLLSEIHVALGAIGKP
jgi:hypothetical protein